MQPAVRFRLLGSVEVRVGDVWRGIPQHKCRQLLGLLLCARGQVLMVERIVPALWGEDRPTTPVGLVRNYVMKLRRAIGDAGEIVTRPGGYQLVVEPERIDAICFEESLHRARRGACEVEIDEALEEALSYWGGPALADVRDCFPLEGEADRLQQLRREAEQMRIERMLDRGSHAEAVAELQLLTASNPDQEGWCELLMIALAGDGRPAEALAAYARHRDHMVERMGLDPSERLDCLQQRLLQGESDFWEPRHAVNAASMVGR